jgi:hypothetical protein
MPVDPDVFITLAFCSLTLVLWIGITAFLVSETRQEGSRGSRL